MLQVLNILKKTQSNTLGYLAIITYLYPILNIQFIYPTFIHILSIVYAVDLTSGLVHVYLDNYNGNNPFIVPHAIGFQNHHTDPREFTTRPVAIILSETSSIVILINLFNFYFLDVYLLLFTFLIHIVQLTHYQAHCINHNTFSEHTNRILKCLQQHHIILSTESHSNHHQTYDNNFCILTGWANPFLNYCYRLCNVDNAK